MLWKKNAFSFWPYTNDNYCQHSILSIWEWLTQNWNNIFLKQVLKMKTVSYWSADNVISIPTVTLKKEKKWYNTREHQRTNKPYDGIVVCISRHFTFCEYLIVLIHIWNSIFVCFTKTSRFLVQEETYYHCVLKGWFTF